MRRYNHYLRRTGAHHIGVRFGYSDWDVWSGYAGGGHLLAATIDHGAIDAPVRPPSGGSTALAMRGSSAWERQMRDTTSPHVCGFNLCTCGGTTVHIHQV